MIADAPVLGCIGRLHEQKNFQLAIRIMAHVSSGHLFLAGNGEQETMLRNLAKEIGVDTRVHFLGPLAGADVSRFYRAVDWLLMPSLYEGHPLVMLEAMAAGAPVIAHDVPVMREAGDDAALYCSSDPIKWAEMLCRSDEAIRGKMIVKGKARTAHFAKASMVDEYLRVANLPDYKKNGI
jgi:glycosyltransferase involved in cell wall biosynthesis